MLLIPTKYAFRSSCVMGYKDFPIQGVDGYKICDIDKARCKIPIDAMLL